MCTKNLVSYGSTLFQRRAFIACTRPRHSLYRVVMLRSYLYMLNYLSGPRPTIARSICYVQLAITFTLYFGLSNYSYNQLLVVVTRTYRLEFDLMLEPFITHTRQLAITSTLAAAIVVKVFCCLAESCIGCSKLMLEKYYVRAKFRKQPIIELHTASQNKFFLVVSPFWKFGKICTQEK